MNTLKVALVQTDLVWEAPDENRRVIGEKVYRLEQEVDLIILPEMFTSGFTMNPASVAETMQGETLLWLQEIAKRKQAAILGSLVIEQEEKYYNRLLFVQPDGSILYYDKRHLFTLAGENEAYTAGTEKLVIDYKGWKICPMICYDLRFPVWSRNVDSYDFLIYIANWPKPRIEAWETLLKARAIENVSYCAGVNRIGVDSNGYEYTGNSVVFDPLGKTLFSVASNENAIAIVQLDKSYVSATREKLPFLEDRDSFTLY